MQPASQHAARENDIPGYRDDSPKRGGNVTSNKKDSLLDKGRRGWKPTTSTSEGNDQRGALIT